MVSRLYIHHQVSQEFALRFLRGDFRNADPGKGRFRDFLKRAVYHLMIDHHRARRAHARPLDEAGEPEDLGPSIADLDASFVESWRDELLRGPGPRWPGTRIARAGPSSPC